MPGSNLTSRASSSGSASTRLRVSKAILSHARDLAASTWCAVCHSLDPGGPLRKRKVCLRSPASGARSRSESTDFDLRDQWGPGRVALLDRTLGEVMQSAEQGCPWCDLINRACIALGLLNEQDNGVPEGEANIWLEAFQNPKITIWGPANNATSFELFTAVSEAKNESRVLSYSWQKVFYPLKLVSSNAEIKQSLPFIQNRLSECLASHKECASPTISSAFTPARLLRVTDDGCQLVCFNGRSKGLEPQAYVALSYCWGKVASTNRIVRTVRQNLDHNMVFIAQAELPLAIQDAMKLTRLLNIEYLWIDALCIVQDDVKDWELHVAEMGIIYRHAHLVIAAGSSSSSNEPFLSNRPGRPASVGLDFAPNGEDSSGRVFCRLVQGTGMHENYEERILATRVVIFSSTELQWICKGSQVCEAGHHQTNAGQQSSDQSLSVYGLTSAPETYAFWHRLVKEFSRRHLSYPSDKLPALAGIASIVAALLHSDENGEEAPDSQSGSHYMAGLWKDNLFHDLCWERHMWEIVPWRATHKWRAPSFSWASVEGNVLYNDEGLSGGGKDVVYLSEVLDAGCTTISSANPFGGVVDGYVRLRGPLKACRIQVHPLASPGFIWSHRLHVVGTPWKVEFRSDVPLARARAAAPPLSSGQDNEPEYTAVRAKPPPESDDDANPQLELEGGESAWLLLMGFWHQKYQSRVEDSDMWISCIILGRSTRVPGAFERLGFVNTHWPPWGSKFPHKEYLDLIPFIWGEEGKEEIRIV
ncbi:HET domain containing protein [Naviculisporaceae sp. PSN 640]